MALNPLTLRLIVTAGIFASLAAMGAAIDWGLYRTGADATLSQLYAILRRRNPILDCVLLTVMGLCAGHLIIPHVQGDKFNVKAIIIAGGEAIIFVPLGIIIGARYLWQRPPADVEIEEEP